jgi:hypothetical protein
LTSTVSTICVVVITVPVIVSSAGDGACTAYVLGAGGVNISPARAEPTNTNNIAQILIVFSIFLSLFVLWIY